MKILITGVAGFIGSSLAERLISGNEIYGIDNFDPFYPPDIKKSNISGLIGNRDFKLFESDIRSSHQLSEIFLENNFDLVIHLAAKAGVRPSIQDPVGYYETNVRGTMNILEAMRESNVKKMIFASSSSVYGNNSKVPFSELDTVDFPISPYAASKKAGELLCHTYHHLYGFDITCLRFFTVFGPRQRPDLAIHKFTNAIYNKEEFHLFGDGSTSRDYTYIDDIIDGISLSMSSIGGFKIYNLGESKTITLREMVDALVKVTGIEAKLQYLPMQPGDVVRTFADITLAKKELGYNPRWNFIDGLIEFINWFNNNLRT
jgi:UDP-glucuronate 4-epimerase